MLYGEKEEEVREKLGTFLTEIIGSWTVTVRFIRISEICLIDAVEFQRLRTGIKHVEGNFWAGCRPQRTFELWMCHMSLLIPQTHWPDKSLVFHRPASEVGSDWELQSVLDPLLVV